MRKHVLCAAMLSLLTLACSPANAEDAAKKDTSGIRCEGLPNELTFDSGKLVLQRAGDHWTKTKGSAPSKSFVYIDEDKRVYEFRYWTGSKYRCLDTGRQANK